MNITLWIFTLVIYSVVFYIIGRFNGYHKAMKDVNKELSDVLKGYGGKNVL